MAGKILESLPTPDALEVEFNRFEWLDANLHLAFERIKFHPASTFQSIHLQRLDSRVAQPQVVNGLSCNPRKTGEAPRFELK